MSGARARVAVDLGGTKVLAVVEGAQGPGGPFLASSLAPTQADRGAEAIFETLCAQIDEVLRQADCRPSSLGVCVPGIVDPQTGVVMDCSNLPGWDRFPLASRLGDRFGVPIAVENDARAACWAEASSGAGVGHENLAFVTLSTGIGAGFVFGGRLYRGARGVAGELGEMKDEAGDPVERRGGGLGFQKRWGFGSEDLRTRFDNGDEIARQAFGSLVSYTGRLLANLATLVDPEVIIVGGGLARLGPWFLEALQARISAEAYSLAREVPLVPARWAGEAGVRGLLGLG